MNYKDLLVLSIFSILSLILTIYILGFNYASFTNTQWLAAHDVSTDIISWKFFKNDIWRFPIGSNPNYGMDIGSGMAFSGSVPIMSFIFKLFSDFLPDNFHYFNLWIYICLFLQSYVAYLIIFDQTKNHTYSIIGSLFFILSPVLINRLSFHLSLCAHWLILMGFYLEIKKNVINKNLKWAILISISSLIHFYFTVILSIIFITFIIFKKSSYKNLKESIFKIFFVYLILTLTMFVVGYFDVPFTDALAYGYGNYSLDLASFFINKTNVVNGSIYWSSIFKGKNITSPESFAYLGLGGILFLILFITLFIKDFKKISENKIFLPFLLIILIFLIISVTNKIYIQNQLIFSFDIPNILYGLLSIVRASGRLVWPVYYLIFLFSIIYIYKKFSNSRSIIILISVFFIQLIDIYPGIKRHFNSDAFIKEKSLDTSFWNNLSKDNIILRTTYLNNQSRFLLELRNVLMSKNIIQTDISIHGRYNRKKASIARSKLYNNFENNNFPKNIIFAVDNLNHLRHLKFLFQDKNIGFFFRDNIWVAVSGYKEEMTKDDKDNLKKYEPIVLKKNEINYLKFNDNKSIHGLGWTHNLGSNKKGIWTEGNNSSLLFKLDENLDQDLKVEIKINSILTKDNNPLNFKILVNDKFYKNFNLKTLKELNNNTIFLDIDKSSFNGNTFHIKFLIENPITKLELLKSPDARMLGILIESIILK